MDNLGPDGKPISFTQYPPGSELGASGFDPRPYIDEERRAAEAQAQGAQGTPVKGGSRRRSRRSRKSKRSRKSRRTRR
jgi:hypothetical protein